MPTMCFALLSGLTLGVMRLQILKDVSEEHAKKTITVDPFPHGNFTAASIHPCKHSSVMKKLSSMAQSGSSKELLVDQCAPLADLPIASGCPLVV